MEAEQPPHSPTPPPPRPNLFLKTDFLCTLLDIEAFLVLFVAGLSVNPLFEFLHPSTPDLYHFFLPHRLLLVI